jgi:Family of unknown function (DUF5996)
VTDGRHADASWPELPWREWANTMATLHMWTQIVGKIKLARSAKPEHPWLVALHVNDRGLTTGVLPYDGRDFSIDFDFVEHRVQASDDGGRLFRLDLEPMTVADFYRLVMAGLAGLDIVVPIRPKPFDVADPIPFDEDDVHRTYQRDQVAAFWAALREAHQVLTDYQAAYAGEASPVVFYWGSFDVATSRFARSAGAAGDSTPIESACGWWPLDRRVGPAFYAYTVPPPAGFKEAAVMPSAARFDETLGEFILPWDAVRPEPHPAGEVRAFLDSTRQAGAQP